MIENQAHVFLWSILIGIIIGFIFDLFRIMRRKGHTKDILVYIQDIVFWIIVVVVIIVSTFLINNGELRGYMIFGYILGGAFYILLASRIVRKTITLILDFIENIIKSMYLKLKEFILKIFNKKDKKIKN